MELIVRFENPDNINYKMLFYKGPRSRGIGKPVFNGKMTVKNVKYGDVFCYKTYAEGYYTYKKSFVINETDIANGEKCIRLAFDKRKNCGYEPDSVNYWTDEVETKLVSGEYEIAKEYELDTPAFSDNKAMHEFTTIDECKQYVGNICAGSGNANLFYLNEREDIPVIVISQDVLSEEKDLMKTMNRLKCNNHLKVMYQAQIHGNEPAAGEAALYVIKQLCQDEEILQKLDVIVIPHVNPYGARKFVRFSDEKKTNLNRDSLILESEITRELREIYLTLMPEVFIDAHEFCGPFNNMFDEKNGNYLKMNDDIQVTCLNNLNRNPEIYNHEKNIVEYILDNLRRQGFRCFCYKPGCDYSTSCGYARVMSSYNFSIETNGIGRGKIHFERRVISQIETIRLILNKVAEQTEKIKREVADSRNYRPDEFVLKHSLKEDDVMWLPRLSYDFFGNVMEDKDKTVPYYNVGEATQTMPYPKAYVLDKAENLSEKVKDILVRNGAIYEEIAVGSKVRAESYRKTYGKKGWKKSECIILKNGAYVFNTDQIAANMIIASLEPEVRDITKGNGIARPVDLLIKNCRKYPVYRIMKCNIDCDIEN